MLVNVRTMTALLCAGALSAAAVPVMKRLPVSVLPENVFLSLGNFQFSDSAQADVHAKLMDRLAKDSTYNLVTLTLRCEPDLNDDRTKERVSRFIRRAHACGMQVMMDTDPRIARGRFLAERPDECERMVQVARVAATNGTAVASAALKRGFTDHMTGGTRPYDATSTSLLGGWAVKRDGTKRRLNAKVAASTATEISASADGLASDEDFVAVFEFRLYSIDVFSPFLLEYTRGLMETYRALGADGAMRDEWGHPPSYDADQLFAKNLRHWYSPHFAEAYAKATGGRVLADDFVEMTFGGAGAEAMVDAYNRVNLERNVAIERHHFFTTKELFGDDTYVAKHPTWWGSLDWPEFRHDGLHWWQAKREWAQSDETTAVPVDLALTKKWGHGWMNEGYQNDPKKYAPLMWRYALAGGRMVFHGVYPSTILPRYREMKPADRSFAVNADILDAGGALAQRRIRLANLLSESVPDSPVAFVFGHMNLMNWLRKDTYNDWGAKPVAELMSAGWFTDAYPSTELANFKLGSDGLLAMGAQRYRALVLYHPDEGDARAFSARLGENVRTRVFKLAKGESADAVKAYLETCGVGRQPAVCRRGAWNGDQWPEADGTLRLIDGSRLRFKAIDSCAGDPMSGTLDADGVKVAYEAVGFFGARTEGGVLTAIGGAQVKVAKAPGLSIQLDSPEDFVLRKDALGWYGVLQRSDLSAPIPAALLAVTSRWTLLAAPDVK